MSANSRDGDEADTTIEIGEHEIRVTVGDETVAFDYDPDTRVATYCGEGFPPAWAEAGVKRTGAFLE